MLVTAVARATVMGRDAGVVPRELLPCGHSAQEASRRGCLVSCLVLLRTKMVNTIVIGDVVCYSYSRDLQSFSDKLASGLV